MVATGLAYATAILLWAPDYLFKVLPLILSTYYDYHPAALSELISPICALKTMIS